MVLRVVDEDGDLLGPDLLGAVPEDEEHGVDDVGLAGSVGPDDGREGFVERAQRLFPRVRLEVVVLDVGDD